VRSKVAPLIVGGLNQWGAMAKPAVNRSSIRIVLLVAVTVLLGLVSATPIAANTGSHSGRVLPPDAHPFGYSLDRITRDLAVFSSSNNDLKFLPDTPFQVLYADPDRFIVTADGTGLLFTGFNSFTVEQGTLFFVPLWNANDTPPVVPGFPRSAAKAKTYFFGAAHVGARDFEIIIDGKSTPIGSRYLGGPVKTAPLPGGGNHMITLGAFLSPLASGVHSVTIRGGVFGAGIPATTDPPVDFLREDITYTVEVVKHRR